MAVRKNNSAFSIAVGTMETSWCYSGTGFTNISTIFLSFFYLFSKIAYLLLHPAVILGYNFTVEYRDEFMSEEAINFAVFSSAEITATPPLSFCVTCRFSD
jgi:hypothetical protein